MYEGSFLREFVMILPVLMACIAVPLNGFALFLILKKSPKCMDNYKYVMIFALVMSFEFDVSVSLIVRAIPLPGAQGVQMIGLLALLYPSAGNAICCLGCYSLVLQGMTVVFCFSYREYLLTQVNDTKRSKLIRWLQVVFVIVWTILIIPFYTLTVVSDADARSYMECINYPVPHDRALWVVVPEKKNIFNIFTIYIANIVLIMSVYMGRSIKRIHTTLAHNRRHLSSYSLRMHRMLFTALIWQTSIPFALLIGPLIAVISIVYVLPLVGAEVNGLEQGLTGIALAGPSLFSTAHILSMIYFTSPYKKFCLSLFVKRHQNRLGSVSFAITGAELTRSHQ